MQRDVQAGRARDEEVVFPTDITFVCVDDDVNSDSYRSHPDGDGEPALASLTPEEKSKCVREHKRVEKRSRKFGIFLNRAKMERMNGNRLALVLASYDRFISILEEMPADFAKLLDMAIESHRKGEVFCARKNAAATP